MGIRAVHAELRKVAQPARARASAWYFQTRPGGYGEGDRFLGVAVPDIRRVARRQRNLPWGSIEALLRSPVHEERLLALFLLVARVEKGDAKMRAYARRTYFRNLAHVNNWDLVDASAPALLGPLLHEAPGRSPQLLRSSNLWKRRIAMIATRYEVRQRRTRLAFNYAVQLMDDPEPLIHKAAGWVLREAGKVNPVQLVAFLRRHAERMPRMMLRYAIERLTPIERKAVLVRSRHAARF